MLIDLLLKSAFSISILSSNLLLLDLNRGIECEPLGWEFIILKTLVEKQSYSQDLSFGLM